MLRARLRALTGPARFLEVHRHRPPCPQVTAGPFCGLRAQGQQMQLQCPLQVALEASLPPLGSSRQAAVTIVGQAAQSGVACSKGSESGPSSARLSGPTEGPFQSLNIGHTW